MALVRASDGNMVDPDSAAHTYTYSGGLIATDSFVDAVTGNTYTKTYTWSGSSMTSESKWVKQ